MPERNHNAAVEAVTHTSNAQDVERLADSMSLIELVACVRRAGELAMLSDDELAERDLDRSSLVQRAIMLHKA